jgi:hypothetical protein
MKKPTNKVGNYIVQSPLSPTLTVQCELEKRKEVCFVVYFRFLRISAAAAATITTIAMPMAM